MSQTEKTQVVNVAVIAEILSSAVSTPSVEVVENAVEVTAPINEATLSPEAISALEVLRSEETNLNEVLSASFAWVNGAIVVSIAPTALATETATETAEATTEA